MDINSRTRREAKATISRAESRIAHWAKQEEGAPVMLSIEAQLQKLFGMRALDDVKSICEEVEEIIINSFDDGIGEQLAQTAYNSLCAVGFDCSSFEWALEVKRE